MYDQMRKTHNLRGILPQIPPPQSAQGKIEKQS